MTSSLQVGVLIGHKYTVTRLLKAGAVAQATLVRRYQEFSSGPELVLRLSASERETRLQQETNILRRLSYFDKTTGDVAGPVPEAAAFVDEGRHEGAYYLVTEYIPHDRYATVVQAWEQGLGERWIMPVCRAFVQFLSKVHQQSVEYYDVKRDHLYWNDAADPPLRVIDFNLCKDHLKDGPGIWQQEDLRRTAIMVAQMLQKSQNVPECEYPLPLPPDWPTSLDVQGLPGSVSESARAVLAWLHGGFYRDADAAARDLQAVEHELVDESTEAQWLPEAVRRRRAQAEEYIRQARNRNKDGSYDAAWAHLGRAWACLPFKRVSADQADDSLAARVYLHALWLRYVDEDGRIADGFRSWLDGQYDDALDKLAESGHKDARVALDWLKKRRVIDDIQHADWKRITDIFREGRHADALRECVQYCQEYPEDANAALWLEYFKKVLEQLNSHWWYEREDRPYPVAMARLPQRLDHSQDGRLLTCWQQDGKLQEMCHQMRRTVEMTDVAWQQFSICAFSMAQFTFAEVKDVAIAAIRLHATACGKLPEQGMAEAQKVIEKWQEAVTKMAVAEGKAREQALSRDFSAARETYGRLLKSFRAIVNDYLRQRSAWSAMFPLREEAEAFPDTDRALLFNVAKASMDAFTAREDDMKREIRKLEQVIQQRDEEIAQLKRKGCWSRIFDALFTYVGD